MKANNWMNENKDSRLKGAVRLLGGSVVLGALLFSAGCAHTYVPKESKYKTDTIPMYKVGSLVEFKNGQPNTEEILYAENMGHDFFADLHDWTDKAIAIADRELTERGSKTAGKPGHTLTLRVSWVEVSTGTWGFRGMLTLDAATGTGFAKSFHGEAPSANIYNASSGALGAAVTKMLSDPQIIQYLSQ